MQYKGTLRTCKQGHQYYKSSDCPICEAAKKTTQGFLSTLSAPALRALEAIGVKTIKQLAQHTVTRKFYPCIVWYLRLYRN